MKGCAFMIIPDEDKLSAKGSFGIKPISSNKAPYREIDRKPEMYSYGERSCFITPKSEEDKAKCPRGIKRSPCFFYSIFKYSL